MNNLVTLSVEEFVSIYNCRELGADFEECCTALQKIYGREFFTISAVQAMLQFGKYINEKKPRLRLLIDELNTLIYVPSCKTDANFETSVASYVKKAKALFKSSVIVVDKLTYDSSLSLRREDIVSTIL